MRARRVRGSCRGQGRSARLRNERPSRSVDWEGEHPRGDQRDRRVAQLARKCSQTAGVGYDVGVEKRDVRRNRLSQTGITGRRWTLGDVVTHQLRVPLLRDRAQRVGIGRPVVDHDDRTHRGQRRE